MPLPCILDPRYMTFYNRVPVIEPMMDFFVFQTVNNLTGLMQKFFVLA